MPLKKELLDVLVCPKCKGPLDQVAEPEGFGCAACNLLFAVEDDIPNFLIEEAQQWKGAPR